MLTLSEAKGVKGKDLEDCPYCHSERSEESRSFTKFNFQLDSSVASLPQNDMKRRIQNDGGEGLATTAKR